ncbi:MAG: hypothetical protein WBC44_14320 [Planctomycetaceae bacterium]
MAQARGRYWSDPGPQFDICKEDAVRLLTDAAAEWTKGDLTQPEPEVVLEQILNLFAKKQFLKRPYGCGP